MLRRLLRGLGLGAVGLLLLAGVTAGGGLLWARGSRGNGWMQAQLEDAARPARGGFRVGQLTTDLFRETRLERLDIRDGADRELLGIDSARLVWRLGGLTGKKLIVEELAITGLRTELSVDEQGRLDLADLWDPSSEPSTEPFSLPLTIAVQHLDLSGPRLRINLPSGPVALHDYRLEASLVAHGQTVQIERLRLTAAETTPALGAVDLQLTGVGDPDAITIETLDLALGSQRLQARGGVRELSGAGGMALEIAQLHLEPMLIPQAAEALAPYGVSGAIDATGRVEGTFSAPSVSLLLTTPGGKMGVDARYDGTTTRPRWSAELRPEDLRLDALASVLPPVGVDGTLVFAGEGTEAPLNAEARVDATLQQVPGLGDVTVELAGALDGDRLTLPTLTLMSAKAGVDVDVTWDVATGLGGVGAEELRVDLSLLRDLAPLRAYVPDLPDLSGVPPLDGVLYWSGRVDVGATTVVDGALRGEDLRYDGQGVQALSGPVRVVVDNDPDVDVDLALSGVHLPDRVIEHARLRLDKTNQRVGLDLSGDTDAVEQVALVAGADLRTGALSLDTLRLQATPTLQVVADGQATLTGSAISGLTLNVTAGDARAALTGSADPEGALDLRLAAENLTPAMATGLAPVEGYAGVVDGTVRLYGTAQQPALEALLLWEGLVVPDAVTGLDGSLGIIAANNQVEARIKAVRDEETLATLQARVPVDLGQAQLLTDRPFSARLVLLPVASTTLTALVPDLTLPEFSASAALDLGGTLEHPTARLVGTAALPVGPRQEWVEADLDAQVVGDRLGLSGALRHRFLRRFTLDGGVDVAVGRLMAQVLAGTPPDAAALQAAVGTLDFNLVPLDAPLDDLAGIAGADLRLGGRLLGGVHIGGTLDAPTAEGALLLSDATLGDTKLQPAMVAITAADGGYDLAANFGFGENTGLNIAGFLPFNPHDADPFVREGLSVTLSGPGVPLSLISGLESSVADASGNLVLTGQITGTLAAPQPSLALQIADGGFTLNTTHVRYDDVDLDLGVTPTSIDLRNLSLRTAPAEEDPRRIELVREEGPSLKANAKLTLTDGEISKINGEVRMARLWVSDTPDRRLRTSGSFQFLGTPGRLTVTKLDNEGQEDVVLDEARIILDQRAFTGASDLSLHPDITILRGVDAAPPAAEVAEGPLLPTWLAGSLTVNLSSVLSTDVTMAVADDYGDMLAMMSKVEAQTILDGKLTVRFSQGDLQLTGDVLPSRGYAKVMGKTFQIQGGTVAFTGRDYTSPILDITAAYDAGEYGEIVVKISGTPDAPEVSFSSQTLSNDDVLAVLLIGRPMSEMGTGDTQQANLLSMALMAVAQDAVREGLGPLEMVQLDSSGLRGGVSVSRKVSLYTRFNPTQDPDEGNVVELSLQWRLNSDWNVEWMTGTSGFSATALWYTVRF